MKKIKILLITSMPWREDNNIGNSYSNLFGDIDEFEIAHIYCRDGMPYNSKVKKYYQITESRLFKNILKRSVAVGKSFEMDASDNAKDSEPQSKAMNKVRILRWELFFVMRDIIWFCGRWKDEKLYKFIEDFKPDLIFGTLTYMSNINRMMVDLHKRYNLPLVLYSWDDVYSWNHFSWNPLFIIRKLYNRHYIRKSVAESCLMYTITKEMQKEYGSYFNRECKLLYKGYDFKGEPTLKVATKPYRLVFMGNIGAGRWKALVQLAKALETINANGTTAFLDIYTLSPTSSEMVKAMNIEGTARLNKAVPQNEVMKTQQSADILVHVEPLNKRDASFYRLSFSTKLVDYMYNARCILGIGLKTSTLSYIEDNNAGVVVNDFSKTKAVLESLFNNPKSITDYGRNAWNCGKRNHEKEKIKAMLVEDLTEIATNGSLVSIKGV